MRDAPRLVLASGSPQRIRLLGETGYRFDVVPADIDESRHPDGLSPAQLVTFLAVEKARTIAERLPDRIVLGADTLVSIDGRVLGKPVDAADAIGMIRQLSGSTHEVITGVALRCVASGLDRSTHVASTVHMRPLTDGQIERYVNGGDWQGKAGGYGIQQSDRRAGLLGGDPFISRISGEETNIIGLPMPTVRAMLEQIGIRPPLPGGG